mgnify:CR=1 FL=1
MLLVGGKNCTTNRRVHGAKTEQQQMVASVGSRISGSQSRLWKVLSSCPNLVILNRLTGRLGVASGQKLLYHHKFKSDLQACGVERAPAGP